MRPDIFYEKTSEERLAEVAVLFGYLKEDPVTPSATLRLVKLLTIDYMERLAEEA